MFGLKVWYVGVFGFPPNFVGVIWTLSSTRNIKTNTNYHFTDFQTTSSTPVSPRPPVLSARRPGDSSGTARSCEVCTSSLSSFAECREPHNSLLIWCVCNSRNEISFYTCMFVKRNWKENEMVSLVVETLLWVALAVIHNFWPGIYGIKLIEVQTWRYRSAYTVCSWFDVFAPNRLTSSLSHSYYSECQIYRFLSIVGIELASKSFVAGRKPLRYCST